MDKSKSSKPKHSAPKKAAPHDKTLRRAEQDIARQSVLSSITGAMSSKQYRGEVLKCLTSLALPKETDPVRIGSVYGSNKTATAKVFRKSNLVPATLAIAADIPNTNQCAFVFRDALRAMVFSYGLAAGESCTYVAAFTYPCAPAAVNSPLYRTPLRPDLTASNVSPHGSSLYFGTTGLSDNLRGVLASPGNIITVTVVPVPGGVSDTRIVLYKLEGAQWVSAFVSTPFPTVGGGSRQFNIVETGYYAVAFRVDSNAFTTPPMVDGMLELSISHIYSAMTWAQLPLPNIDDNVDAIRAFRIPAVSLMYTNTSAPLNRTGQIVGLQLPKRSNWYDNTDYETLANSAKAESYNVVNGMYGFLKPTSQDDMEMRTFAFQADDNFDYTFELLPPSDYLVIQSNVVDPLGRSGILYPAHHLEFTTQSQWFNTDDESVPHACFQEAVQILSTLPQWHQNEDHLSNIWNWIKDTASSIWNGAKDVVQTLAPLAPLALAIG